MKPYHEELSRQAWSMWQRHITQKYCLADSRILYFWYVLKSISINLSLNSMPCSAYLQWGLIKTKRRVELFQISQKERFTKRLHLLWQPSTLGGNLIMRPSFLHPSKEAFLSPSVSARREYTRTLNLKENLLIYFKNYQDVSYYPE